MIETTTSLLSELRTRSILRRDQLADIENKLGYLLQPASSRQQRADQR
jgi:hypothetical protein